MKLRTLALALVATHLASALAHTGAPVSPAWPSGDVHHTVAPGDTLYSLAQRYLASPRQWPALQRHNAIANPLRLQPGQVVRIPEAWLSAKPVVAVVDFVHGAVNAASRPQVPGMPVAAGAQLAEGTRLQVGEDGYVSVRLADGSLIRVLAGSDVTLDHMRQRTATGTTSVGIGLQRGSVQSTVTRKTTPAQRFDIRTPLAVASVRGTEFDVSVTDGGHTATSVTRGLVAVRTPTHAGTAPGADLLAGEGNTVTGAGTLSQTVKLLPAPDLAALPPVLESTDNTVALAVPAVPQAALYRVRFARDEALVQVVRNANFPTPHFRFDGLPDGPYFVGIRGVDGAGISGVEARAAVTVKVIPAPPPPFYQSPAPGAQVSNPQVLLLCTAVPGVTWFHLQVSRSEDFANPLVDENRLSVCEYTTQPLTPGTWYWRVASISQHSNGKTFTGPFAAPQSFTVLPAAPAFVAAGTAGMDNQVHWDGQTGHTYRIQVAQDEAFAQIVADQATQQPTWDFADLAPNTYYLRVQAIDAAGVASTFSPVRQINTRPKLRTSDGAAVQSSDGTLVTRP